MTGFAFAVRFRPMGRRRAAITSIERGTGVITYGSGPWPTGRVAAKGRVTGA